MPITKDYSSLNTRIGWIGTGVMGKSMCGHLLRKGYPITLNNRTKEKVEELIQKGAKWQDSPKAVAENSDILFTMVGYPKDVEEVYFGEKGIFQGAKTGTVLVDMTTTKPSLSKKIYELANIVGIYSLDAPVTGGDIGARNATLSIMCGGDKEVMDAVMPIFQFMGKSIIYQGPAGSGQHAKLCNQIVIAGTMIGVCESLLYASKSGLEPEQMLESIKQGAAACWTLENLAPRILKKDFSPGFYVAHFIKDMEIILEESQRMGLNLPGLSLVHLLYIALSAMGHDKSGTQSLYLALEEFSRTAQAREH